MTAEIFKRKLAAILSADVKGINHQKMTKESVM
jgi:hypothetical protein